jgi:hypothetical protein
MGEVGADVQQLIEETKLPPGCSLDVGGDLQQGEAFARLLAAMGLVTKNLRRRTRSCWWTSPAGAPCRRDGGRRAAAAPG